MCALRRNGLWIVFVPAGVGNHSDSWRSGRSGMQALAVQLFSVSTFSAPYGRWIVAVSIPLGASVCPLRQRHQSARSRAAGHRHERERRRARQSSAILRIRRIDHCNDAAQISGFAMRRIASQQRRFARYGCGHC